MRKYFMPLIAPVLAAFLAAGAAQGAFYQWSKTAATNATADPSINWSEGQSPSSVNDSARAMMARAAEYRDDISGALTTGGTSTAYTVTTNQVLASVPTTGQLLAFTPHTTNGVNATLRADGGTVYAIQSSPAVAVGAATLVEGTPYTVKFDGTAWILRNFYGNPYAVPIGGLMAYTGATAPNSNFVLPAGQCISRTTYAAYFTQVSTTFGVCDGTTTFGVPDMRGRVVAGLDNIGGSAASRLSTTYFGTDPAVLGNAGGAQNTTMVQGNLPSATLTTTIAAGQGDHLHNLQNTGTAAGGSGVAAGVIAGGGAGVTGSATLPAMTGTTPLGGSATPMSRVMPAMVLMYILRVI